jgi:hypothetical protein
LLEGFFLKGFLFFLYIVLAIVPGAQAAAESSDHLILINVATNQLSYFENGIYMKTFPVSTGKKQTPTPEGKFLIANKYKNKKYNRKQIPGGARNNPLGTRWMGLNYKEYAIHGTNKEGSVGTHESNGCIRMNDRNIQWLYDRVPLHTKVVIAKFYGSAELTAHRFGYRVISWNGKVMQDKQVGRLRLIDRTTLFWQDPNGQFIPVQKAMPNETYPVLSHNGAGVYHVGNNLYIIDPARQTVTYEQLPTYIIVNQYKRKQGVL